MNVNDKTYREHVYGIVRQIPAGKVMTYGQLAIILRARYCEPKIESFTKTDGLTFRVKEILDGVFKGRSFAARKIPRDGAAIVHTDTAPESVKSVREVVPQGVG